MIDTNTRVWLLPLAAVVLLTTAMTAETKADFMSLGRDDIESQIFVELMQTNLANWSFHKDDEVFDDAEPDYTRRPDAVFWDPAPPLQGYRGWAEYRKAPEIWSKHGIVQADISVIEPDKFKTWRYKDVVWNILRCRVRLTMNTGEQPVYRCRGTTVWEWEGDRWRLGHETFSTPVEPGRPAFQAVRPDDPRVEPHIEFTERARQLAAAWGRGTTPGLASRLEPFYLHEDDLSVFTPWPPFDGYQGWRSFQQGLEKDVAGSFKRVTISLNDDLEAQRRGKIAWSHATLHIETEMPDGVLVPGDARQTLIWYLTDEGWRILHEHFSFPQ
jgi:ketosteroid isomerase-like protein